MNIGIDGGGILFIFSLGKKFFLDSFSFFKSFIFSGNIFLVLLKQFSIHINGNVFGTVMTNLIVESLPSTGFHNKDRLVSRDFNDVFNSVNGLFLGWIVSEWNIESIHIFRFFGKKVCENGVFLIWRRF